MREGVSLSTRQPWASLIMWGLKTVEVRSWPTKHRGLLFIHAAKAADDPAMRRFRLENLPSGCLIGTVELVQVELFSESAWEELADAHLQVGPFCPGLWAWRLESPKPLSRPVPYRGDLGLFRVQVDEADMAPQL